MGDRELLKAWQRWCFLATGEVSEAEDHVIAVAPASCLTLPDFVGVVAVGERVIVTAPVPALLHPARSLVAST